MSRPIALLLLILSLTFALPAQAGLVVIVTSENRGPYLEFIDNFRAELRREAAQHDIQVIDNEQLASRNLNEAQLVIGVGSSAMEALAGRDIKVPVLHNLIPRTTYERQFSTRRDERKNSALFVDQAPPRFLDLIRVALPQQERVGLLVGRDSREQANRLTQLAKDRKLRAGVESVTQDSEIYPALQKLFPEGGALLATLDSSIFNSQTVPNIILSAYRLRVPVVGFSPSHVKSGALIALYTTPAQLGTQAAEIAKTALTSGSLPPAQHPRLFTIGINNAAARTLGYTLEAESVLHDRLERLERSTP